MGAIKFETFAPDEFASEETARSREEELTRVRDEAYANGFKDGVSVTNDAFESSQNEISSAIQEALSDASMSQAAIITKSMADVMSVVEAFCSAIAPTFSKSGLSAELGTILETALKDASANQITVSHSAPDEKTVKELISNEMTNINLLTDPTLSQGQIHVGWDNGFSSLDTSEIVARAMLKISNFANMINQQEEDVEHDRRNATTA